MSDDHDDDSDQTPPGRGALGAFGGLDTADLANTGIALATVATRLRHAADLADAAADRCREAARMGEDYGTEARAAPLRDIEEDLGKLGDAVHDTRRTLRDARLAMRDRH